MMLAAATTDPSVPLVTPQWVSAAVAVAAFVVISIPTFIVAYRQFRTARQNLRLSMFDRRWKIYNATSQLLYSAYDGYGRTSMQNWTEFLQDTITMDYLIDDATLACVEKIKDFWHKNNADTTKSDVAVQQGDVDTFSTISAERSTYLNRVSELQTELHKAFATYLDFRKF